MDIVFTYVNKKNVISRKIKYLYVLVILILQLITKDSNSNTKFYDNNQIMYSLISIKITIKLVYYKMRLYKYF